MVLNELATNAVKYGALSGERGQLDVTWTLDSRADGPWVNLQWVESGGPPVVPPSRRGFGSNLIERSITHQLRGSVTSSYRAEGLLCKIAFPTQGIVPVSSQKGV
jgi:two-component system CheB/CheR fusion protein